MMVKEKALARIKTRNGSHVLVAQREIKDVDVLFHALDTH